MFPLCTDVKLERAMWEMKWHGYFVLDVFTSVFLRPWKILLESSPSTAYEYRGLHYLRSPLLQQGKVYYDYE